jgi:hypothetical protein
MTKKPKNYNLIKCVRKKDSFQDKSRRQKTNKRPLRNSTNANKLYSEGGGGSSFYSFRWRITTEEELEELLKEILNIIERGDVLLSKDPSKLIEYLKKTTTYCGKYIDEIFINTEYSKDSKYYTCASSDRIRNVYNLVTEYEKDKLVTEDIDFSKRVFKINLERLLKSRLLKSRLRLSNTEIDNMRDGDASERIINARNYKYNETQRIKERREEKKEERIDKGRKKEKKEYASINEILKDTRILTSTKDLTILDDDNLKDITTIYSNDDSNLNLIIYLNTYRIENINTIILVNFDLNYVTELLNIENIKNIKTLVLKHPVRVGIISIEISAIISLLKVIKEKTILTHFEFSNFYIDLGDSDDTSISELFSLFSSILEKGPLIRFDFVNNTFKNQKALDSFEDLIIKLNEVSTDEGKLRYIVEWLYSFKINPYTDKYIYVEWLKWLLLEYKEGQWLEWLEWSYNKVELLSELTNITQGIEYKNSKKYIYFNDKLLDDKNILNKWLKFLIKIKEKKLKDDHLQDEEYDDIDVRLNIIILYLIKLFNKENSGKDDYHRYLINYIMTEIIILCENKETIKSIIELFNKKPFYYRPTYGNISSKYNKIIIDYIAPPNITNQGENTIISLLKESIKGGCKINRKVALKAPKKAPNVALKAPKKAPKVELKEPKKAPNVALKAPKKAPKVELKAPKKAPKVALKAPKKAPEVELKEPNTYAVIKQKIRVNK